MYRRAPVRPLKLAIEFWELNLTAEGFDRGSWLALGPRATADPIEKVAADVAAIF